MKLTQEQVDAVKGAIMASMKVPFVNNGIAMDRQLQGFAVKTIDGIIKDAQSRLAHTMITRKSIIPKGIGKFITKEQKKFVKHLKKTTPKTKPKKFVAVKIKNRPLKVIRYK